MDVDVESDDLMAQTMGFSSFGAQKPPQKKRRYNPKADAVASTASAAPGTGANSVALAAQRPAAANADEINLDDDNGHGHGDEAPVAQASALPADQAQVRPASLPERPRPGTGFPGMGVARVPGSRQPWVQGYFDPSSLEDPWALLEQEKGVQPRCPWFVNPDASTTGSSAR